MLESGLGSWVSQGLCPIDRERAGEGGKGLGENCSDEDGAEVCVGGTFGIGFSGGVSLSPALPVAAPRQTLAFLTAKTRFSYISFRVFSLGGGSFAGLIGEAVQEPGCGVGGLPAASPAVRAAAALLGGYSRAWEKKNTTPNTPLSRSKLSPLSPGLR